MANIHEVSEALRARISGQVAELHRKAQQVDVATTYELRDLEKCLDIAIATKSVADETVRLLEYAVAAARQDSDCRKD